LSQRVHEVKFLDTLGFDEQARDTQDVCASCHPDVSAPRQGGAESRKVKFVLEISSQLTLEVVSLAFLGAQSSYPNSRLHGRQKNQFLGRGFVHWHDMQGRHHVFSSKSRRN
jgi:hypothetical protein